MGAKKNTKTSTKKGAADERPVAPIELTEDQEKLCAEALVAMRNLVDDLSQDEAPLVVREFALGLARLEEAEMWFDRAFGMLGITVDDEDEEEDEEDEDEDDEEGEDEA